MSREADREFVTLRDQHSAVQNGKRSPVAPKTIEEAVETIKGLARERVNEFMKEEAEAITELAEERKKRVKEEAEINDNDKRQDTSVDWERAGITLYIIQNMALRSGDLMELMKELESTLAHIIGACIEKVGVALVENSRKWAQEMKEKKLLETVYIAGKSIGLIEKLGWDHKLRVAPDSGFNAPTTEESAM